MFSTSRSPTVVTSVVPAGAVFATQPTFSLDSNDIYFLATSVAGGASKSLYFAALSNPSAIALVSAASDPAKSDDIYAYSVASGPVANRGTGQSQRRCRIVFYRPRALAGRKSNQSDAEFRSIHPSSGSSTIGLPPGLGGSPDLKRVAYRVQNPPSAPPSDVDGVYVAEVSTTPNPRSVVRLDSVIGLRPDDAAVLYTDSAQVFEAVIDSGSPGQPLGAGTSRVV